MGKNAEFLMHQMGYGIGGVISVHSGFMILVKD
jgi:hypothetical protein